MSIHLGKRGTAPNWIEENNWSSEKRLEWISVIMGFSSRDWAKHDFATQGTPDPEMWAIWILVNSDSKKDALETWYGYCDDCKDKGHF